MSSPITSFYSNKTILITGATGFVGKVLLEKLIFACRDVRRIYILVREKKGVAASDRLEKLLNSPVFTCANRTPLTICREKIVPIYGDVAQKRLGLTDKDWNMLVDEVNVIINSAASVRFDDPMVRALAINCLSTMSCLQLCKEAKNIAAYVHVSTCYANCNLQTVEEKVYPTKVTAEHLMEMSKIVSSEVLDNYCKDSLFDGRPNSYVFTKALAEDYLSRHSDGLPVAIMRLSMVVAARAEPQQGFIDVLQVFVVLGYAQQLGALRTLRYDPKMYPQCMAVDYAASAILTIGWLTGTKYCNTPLRVYNATKALIKAGHGMEMMTRDAKNFPTLHAARPPVNMSKPHSWWEYQYHRWVSEWLFIFTLDNLLKLFGIDYELTRKINLMDAARETMTHFAFTDWKFPADNFEALTREQQKEDKQLFYLEMNDKSYDQQLVELRETGILAWNNLKRYLLNEDPNDVEKAIKRMKLIRIREMIFNVFMYGLYMSVIYGLLQLVRCLIIMIA